MGSSCALVADTTVTVDSTGSLWTIRLGRADVITPPARPAAVARAICRANNDV